MVFPADSILTLIHKVRQNAFVGGDSIVFSYLHCFVNLFINCKYMFLSTQIPGITFCQFECYQFRFTASQGPTFHGIPSQYLHPSQQLPYHRRLTFQSSQLFLSSKYIQNQLQVNRTIVDVPAGIQMLKINNKYTRTRCEVYLKLTIKIPKRRHWRCSGVFSLTLNIFHTLFQCFY